jgi:hypothetical protein
MQLMQLKQLYGTYATLRNILMVHIFPNRGIFHISTIFYIETILQLYSQILVSGQMQLYCIYATICNYMQLYCNLCNYIATYATILQQFQLCNYMQICNYMQLCNMQLMQLKQLYGT